MSKEVDLFIQLVDRFTTLSYNYPITAHDSNDAEFAISLIERLNSDRNVDIYDVLWSLRGNPYDSEEVKIGYIQELRKDDVGNKIEQAWAEFIRNFETA